MEKARQVSVGLFCVAAIDLTANQRLNLTS